MVMVMRVVVVIMRMDSVGVKVMAINGCGKCNQASFYLLYTLLKSDVIRLDHVSVVMDAGSRIVNFICDGTVFA